MPSAVSSSRGPPEEGTPKRFGDSVELSPQGAAVALQPLSYQKPPTSSSTSPVTQVAPPLPGTSSTPEDGATGPDQGPSSSPFSAHGQHGAHDLERSSSHANGKRTFPRSSDVSPQPTGSPMKVCSTMPRLGPSGVGQHKGVVGSSPAIYSHGGNADGKGDSNENSFAAETTPQALFGGNSDICSLPQLNFGSTSSRRNSLLRSSNGNLISVMLSHSQQQQQQQVHASQDDGQPRSCNVPVTMPELSSSSLQARGATGVSKASVRSETASTTIPPLATSHGKAGEPAVEGLDGAGGAAHSSQGPATVVSVAKVRELSSGTPMLPEHANLTLAAPTVEALTGTAHVRALPSGGEEVDDAVTASTVAASTGGMAVVAMTSAERKEAKRARKAAREERRAAKEARRQEKQQRKLVKEQQKPEEALGEGYAIDTTATATASGVASPASGDTTGGERVDHALSPFTAVPRLSNTSVGAAMNASTGHPAASRELSSSSRPSPDAASLRTAAPNAQTQVPAFRTGSTSLSVPADAYGRRTPSATTTTTSTVAGTLGVDSAQQAPLLHSPHPPSFGMAASGDDFASSAYMNVGCFTSGTFTGDMATPTLLSMHPPPLDGGAANATLGGSEPSKAQGGADTPLADAAATARWNDANITLSFATADPQGRTHAVEQVTLATPLTETDTGSFDDDQLFREQFTPRQAPGEAGVRSFVQSREESVGVRNNPPDTEESDATRSRQVSATFGLRLSDAVPGGIGRASAMRGSGSRERFLATRPRTVYSSDAGTATQQARDQQDEEVNAPSRAKRRLKKHRRPHRRHHSQGRRRRRRRSRHSSAHDGGAPAAKKEEESSRNRPTQPSSPASARPSDPEDTPKAYALLVANAGGADGPQRYSHTTRPAISCDGLGAVVALAKQSGLAGARRCTSAGTGVSHDVVRVGPHSTVNRAGGFTESTTVEPSPPSAAQDAGRQPTHFVRRQHAPAAGDADAIKAALPPITRQPGRLVEAEDRAESTDTTAQTPQPHRPPSVAGSAVAAVMGLQRQGDDRLGPREGSPASSPAKDHTPGRRLTDRESLPSTADKATVNEKEKSHSRRSSQSSASPVRERREKKAERKSPSSPALHRPHPPAAPSGGRRGGRGRGRPRGHRRPTAPAINVEGSPRRPSDQSANPASRSTSSGDSTSYASSYSASRTSSSRSAAAEPPHRPVEDNPKSPAQHQQKARSVSSGSRSEASYSATSSSRSHAFSAGSVSASSASAYSSSYDSVGSSGDYSTSSSDDSVRVASKLPLKAGFTVAPPAKAFTDVAYRMANPAVLQAYAERAVIHEWSLRDGCWGRVETHVVLSPDPFSQGNMRASYHMVDLKRLNCRLIAKRYLKASVEDDQYFDDVSMHSISGHWARLYNATSPPKKVKFVPAAVLELPDRQPPLILAMEPELEGTFRKYNNNCGYVPRNARWTPQAFSHFTYYASGHALLIVDIQGVGDIYTDPQILSPDGEGYGRGNLGRKGIRRFLKTHRCNGVCKALGLPNVDSPVQLGVNPSATSFAAATASPKTRFASAEFDAIREERLPPKAFVRPTSNTTATGSSSNNASLQPSVGPSPSAAGQGWGMVPSMTTGLSFSPSPPPHAAVLGNGLLSPNPGNMLHASPSPPATSAQQQQQQQQQHNPKFMKHIRHQLSRQQSTYFANGASAGFMAVPGGYGMYAGNKNSSGMGSTLPSDTSNPPSRGPGTPKTTAIPVIYPPSSGFGNPSNVTATSNSNGASLGNSLSTTTAAAAAAVATNGAHTNTGNGSLSKPGSTNLSHANNGAGVSGPATIVSPWAVAQAVAQQQQQQTPMNTALRPLVLPLSSMEVKPPCRHTPRQR